MNNSKIAIGLFAQLLECLIWPASIWFESKHFPPSPRVVSETTRTHICSRVFQHFLEYFPRCHNFFPCYSPSLFAELLLGRKDRQFRVWEHARQDSPIPTNVLFLFPQRKKCMIQNWNYFSLPKGWVGSLPASTKKSQELEYWKKDLQFESKAQSRKSFRH